MEDKIKQQHKNFTHHIPLFFEEGVWKDEMRVGVAILNLRL